MTPVHPDGEASRELDSSIEQAVDNGLVRMGRRVLADCKFNYKLSLTRTEWFAVIGYEQNVQAQ